MNKLSLLILILLITSGFESYSQYLVSVVNVNSISIEMDQNKVEPAHSIDYMLIPNNSADVMIYQNELFTYWIDYKLKQCGKKVKLSGSTYILLKDGTRQDGKQFSNTKKIGDEGPAFITGNLKDEIKLSDSETKEIKTSFNYVMRYMN